MTTDANFVGGGDNANPNQLNGSNAEQAVNSGQQEVKPITPKDYGVPGLSKFFAKHPQLSDLDKKMLAALYKDGQSKKVVKQAAKRLMANAVTPANSDTSKGFLVDLTDEAFVNYLLVTHNLNPDDLMTLAGMVQRGLPRDLIERTAKRFGEYPPERRIVDNRADNTNTKSTPKPMGELGAPLEILVNARYGISHSDVLIFALTEYQQSRLQASMKSLEQGLYDDAADELSDFDSAGTMLTEFALSLSKLADRNYWASVGETPQGNSKPSSVFESYAKHYFGFSDERIQGYVKEKY